MTDQPERRAQLERRIEEYHGVNLAEVLEIIDYLRDEADSVIAGGSLALGLGNRSSDLDIVIAGERVEPSAVPLEHFVKTLRVDVWKRAQSDVDQVFARAETGLASDGPLDELWRNVDEEADLKLLHRVAFGILIEGEPLVPTRTREYPRIARELVAREYGERMRDAAFVAQVAAAAGRSLTATTSARLMVEAALHATIAQRDLPFTGDKWLQQRLAQDAPDLEELYAPFRVLPRPDAEFERFVADAVETCRELTGVDLDAERLPRDAVWDASGLDVMKVGPDQMMLAREHGTLWQLAPDEADTWSTLVERDGGMQWSCADCSEAETRLCLALLERGVAKLRWRRGLPVAALALDRSAQT